MLFNLVSFRPKILQSYSKNFNKTQSYDLCTKLKLNAFLEGRIKVLQWKPTRDVLCECIVCAIQ
jgi:hypothetical protein